MTPDWLIIASATLVSEDLTCLATGLLIAQGRVGYAEGTLACLGGIVAGDLALFAAGRLLGRRALRWKPFARLVSEERLARASEWLARRGMSVVFLSRFTPGLRLPTYFAAGLLRTRALRFAGYFVLASALWTPLLVGAAALGSNIAGYGIAVPVVFGLVRVAPHWRRVSRWEFWPSWAAYLPLVPYFLFLSIRQRSPTLFTAANPGIYAGGLTGESKVASLGQLPGAAEFTLIPAALPFGERVERALRFGLPMVLKPDQGERGVGVAIIRTEAQREAYLREATCDVIAQEYVEGAEYGIFYCRIPGEAHGRILSVTEKLFPVVRGDGRSRLGELVRQDDRAAVIEETYRRLSHRSMDEVPAEGERVQLVEIGSHCRGAIFADGSRLITPELEEAIERIARAHEGFYFGRFDLRAPSAEHLRRGEGLRVLELNGVAGEPAHIYDPAVSLLDAYRALFRHWRLAFLIGRLNVERGARPMPLVELARLLFGR
jgi:membrane protein DedA with SNARE-associated domain